MCERARLDWAFPAKIGRLSQGGRANKVDRITRRSTRVGPLSVDAMKLDLT